MTKANWVILIVLFAVCPMAAAEPISSAKPSTSESQDRRLELAAEHAHLLSQIKWTPVADTMPNRSGGYFKKGKQYTGVPYSSVRSTGRYIGFDISLRTFLAAVENPQSVLYTENLTGKIPNAAPYYGTVCSAFTSYSLQCGVLEVSRRHGPAVSPGIVLVEPQSAQAARTGDVIYTPHRTANSGSHVELVTAVEQDRAGRVTRVRVEESRPPTAQTTDRSADIFDSHLASGNRQLFRITDLDAWRGANRAESFLFPNYETDSATSEINRTAVCHDISVSFVRVLGRRWRKGSAPSGKLDNRVVHFGAPGSCYSARERPDCPGSQHVTSAQISTTGSSIADRHQRRAFLTTQ